MNSGQTVLQCNALSKNYGSTRALSDVTLTLNAGPPIALIGPNGAGKTTFLSLLCGFIKPTQGQVTVLGETPGSAKAVRRISALPQDAWPDPVFSIARQLHHYAQLRGLSRRDASTEALRVLSLVQLEDRANDKPEQLSHGMRKRIMIAQALIGDPDLILLDEPTAGIDPPNVKIIRELIASQADKATFIISSHNLDELEKVCTSVVHLAQGELRGNSTIDTDADEGFLSLTLRRNTAADAVVLLLQNLPGVLQVNQRSAVELVIEYDRSAYPDTDVRLLTALSQEGWEYKKLVKGRSLEEQLFS